MVSRHFSSSVQWNTDEYLSSYTCHIERCLNHLCFNDNLFFAVAAQVDVHYKERRKILQRCRKIRLTSFVEHRFLNFSDAVMLQLFRFRRADIYRLVPFIAWPEAKHRTKRNRYAVTPLLVTCVVLRRLASPTLWADLELLFGLLTSQLSEVFWKGCSIFWRRDRSLF